MSKMPAISFFVGLDVFGENQRCDFCVLIICLEHLQNIWRIFFKILALHYFCFREIKDIISKEKMENLI